MHLKHVRVMRVGIKKQFWLGTSSNWPIPWEAYNSNVTILLNLSFPCTAGHRIALHHVRFCVMSRHGSQSGVNLQQMKRCEAWLNFRNRNKNAVVWNQHNTAVSCGGANCTYCTLHYIYVAFSALSPCRQHAAGLDYLRWAAYEYFLLHIS